MAALDNIWRNGNHLSELEKKITVKDDLVRRQGSYSDRRLKAEGRLTMRFLLYS
jgi:hypothetical protein